MEMLVTVRWLAHQLQTTQVEARKYSMAFNVSRSFFRIMEEYWKRTRTSQKGITALFMTIRKISEEHIKMVLLKEMELLPGDDAFIYSLQFGELTDTRILGSINANLHVRPDIIREGMDWVDPNTISTPYQKQEQAQIQKEIDALNPKVFSKKTGSPSPKKPKISDFFQKNKPKGLNLSDEEMDKAMDEASTAMEDTLNKGNSPPVTAINTSAANKPNPNKRQGNLMSFFKPKP